MKIFKKSEEVVTRYYTRKELWNSAPEGIYVIVNSNKNYSRVVDSGYYMAVDHSNQRSVLYADGTLFTASRDSDDFNNVFMLLKDAILYLEIKE